MRPLLLLIAFQSVVIKDTGMKNPEAAMYKINIYHIPGSEFIYMRCVQWLHNGFPFFCFLLSFYWTVDSKGLGCLGALDVGAHKLCKSAMHLASAATAWYCVALQRGEADGIFIISDPLLTH